MEKLFLFVTLAFLLCCIDSYLVYRKKMSNTTKKVWISHLAAIFGGGISIILMIYYLYLKMNWFVIFISPIAIFPLVPVFQWQISILKPGIGHKILCSLILIAAYIMCWCVGLALGPATGHSLYHG